MHMATESPAARGSGPDGTIMAVSYRPAFYPHAGVLHMSLILRVVGDLFDSLGRRYCC